MSTSIEHKAGYIQALRNMYGVAKLFSLAGLDLQDYTSGLSAYMEEQSKPTPTPTSEPDLDPEVVEFLDVLRKGLGAGKVRFVKL